MSKSALQMQPSISALSKMTGQPLTATSSNA